MALCAALCANGCAKKRTSKAPARVPPQAIPRGTVETGIASWYGNPYHGRRTANGEVYDMEQMTAAHRTLPFNTQVRVTNLGNRKSVEVRITDRGPFIDGRIIDLSRVAARTIDMIGPGTARVRVETLGAARLAGDGPYGVQAGVFGSRESAERMKRSLEKQMKPVKVVERRGSPRTYRVIVGKKKTAEEAEALAAQLRGDNAGVFVVRWDESDSSRE